MIWKIITNKKRTSWGNRRKIDENDREREREKECISLSKELRKQCLFFISIVFIRSKTKAKTTSSNCLTISAALVFFSVSPDALTSKWLNIFELL